MAEDSGQAAEGAILSFRSVTRHFGGLVAVDDVSLDVKEGEIFSIIGPNGAGKTTLFNVVTGVFPPTSGEILFEGRVISGDPQHKIAAAGISRTFQATQLLLEKSATENLMMAAHRMAGTGLLDALLRTRRFAEDEARLQARVDELLAFMELECDRDLVADELSTADRQRLAIAMALMSSPRLLMLDEPTGGLIEKEVDDLMGLVRRIRDAGTTVVLIEHKMRMVMQISDRIAVLDHGEKIAEDVPSVVRSDPAVLEAYLGADYVA